MRLDDVGWSTVVGHLVMISTGAARFLDHGSSNPPGSNKLIDLGGESVYSEESSRIVAAAVRACWSECAAEKEIRLFSKACG
jgi:hypothetical protein